MRLKRVCFILTLPKALCKSIVLLQIIHAWEGNGATVADVLGASFTLSSAELKSL